MAMTSAPRPNLREWYKPSLKVKQARKAARAANKRNTAYMAHMTLNLPDYLGESK